jgi:hypothetical protein
MGFHHQWDDFEHVKFNHDLCSCGCGQRQDHLNRFDHHDDFQDFCNCHKKHQRLKPLDFGLAQRLRRLLGCKVVVELLSSEEDEQIVGTLCLVGTNFIEICKIVVENEIPHEKVQFIPFNAIKFIKLA